MSKPLEGFEQWDYERLKRLEMRSIEAYREMRKAPSLSPEALVAFIAQLSPWNLKTTGVSVLKAYKSEAESKPNTKATEAEDNNG